MPTQELRFVQLLKVCDFRTALTLNDLGCGYGALLAFLRKRHPKKTIDYQGVDLSTEMIAQARRLWIKRPAVEFLQGNQPQRLADYGIASGIFNVKLHQPLALWIQFIQTTLLQLHASSRHGFAVNFLAPLQETFSPKELYRADPALWCSYCESVLQAKVELIADYGMPEYTLLVRKTRDARGLD